MSASVFPARAGMSPAVIAASDDRIGVPRASGDEPISAVGVEGVNACSPRERG